MSTTQWTVVRPRGRLDAFGSPALDLNLKREREHGNKHIVVDLSDTTYISSNGLRVLLGALKATRATGGHLKLCGLSDRLREIFEMVGFDQLFEILGSCSEAESKLES